MAATEKITSELLREAERWGSLFPNPPSTPDLIAALREAWAERDEALRQRYAMATENAELRRSLHQCEDNLHDHEGWSYPPCERARALLGVRAEAWARLAAARAAVCTAAASRRRADEAWRLHVYGPVDGVDGGCRPCYQTWNTLGGDGPCADGRALRIERDKSVRSEDAALDALAEAERAVGLVPDA